MTTSAVERPFSRTSCVDAYSITRVYEMATHRSAWTNAQGGKFKVRCPNRSHEDKHPSCVLTENTGRWKCFACGQGGGKLQLIVAAGLADNVAEAARWLETGNRHLEPAALEPQPAVKTRRSASSKIEGERCTAVYAYRDEERLVRYEVKRMESAQPGPDGRTKRFIQRARRGPDLWVYRMDGVERIPYRLPELMTANAERRAIVIAEGEKIVDMLTAVNIAATCNCGGSTCVPTMSGPHARPEWKKYFEHSPIKFVLADSDQAGRESAARWAEFLTDGINPVIVVDLFPDREDGSDAIEWLQEAGIIAPTPTDRSRAPADWDRDFLVGRAAAGQFIRDYLTNRYHAWYAANVENDNPSPI
jgi:hypothetical protein